MGIGAPETVCVGLYAVEILESNGLIDDVRQARTIVTHAQSCSKTASLIALKSVDAILGWRVFSYWNPDTIDVVFLEPGQIPRLAYVPGAISTFTKDRESAQKFLDFLTSPEVVEYIEKKLSASELAQGIAVKKADFNNLAFSDCQFDLIIFRGAFFFLGEKENLLREIFRVLKKGGLAFVGGGHGKGVPQEIINQIADELRKLHKKLGGRWLSIGELQEIVSSSQLADNCKIIEEGGVWLKIQK